MRNKRVYAVKVAFVMVLLSILTGYVPFALSATIYVPDDYSAVQAAIDIAIDGDIIIVRPGSYYENITFMGKAITVKSTNPKNPEVVKSTIIDGSNSNFNGSVVTFSSGEGPDSVLTGITLKNGRSLWGVGGGIYCSASSPTITKCFITRNSADSSNGEGLGGGIFCETGSPRIIDCRIIANIASGGGGGIYSYQASPIISNCTISGNKANGLYSSGGGGICLQDSSLTLTKSTISNNLASQCGGGISNYSTENSGINIAGCTIVKNICRGSSLGCGGGIYSSSNATIANCTITENSATSEGSGNFSGGGGIYFEYGSSGNINHCTIRDNAAQTGGGIYITSGSVANSIITGNTASNMGGGIFISSTTSSSKTPMKIVNCLINKNSSGMGGGGGIYVDWKCSPAITNCTITENLASTVIGSGGGIGGYGASPKVVNSILWNNLPNEIDEGEWSENIYTISFSDVKVPGGVYPGLGNINQDPGFVNPAEGDYHLQSDSPCVDAGTSGPGIPPRDLDGNPRDTTPDMGAYEL